MRLGVYIQVPFCQTKCTYCNFHTGVVPRDRYEPYVEALCREIRATTLPDAVVDSVYIGGGTPSLLEPASLEKILDTLCHEFRAISTLEAAPPIMGRDSERMEESAFFLLEVTLEADPETVTPEKAAAWLAAGFNRISLGAQSFHDAELRASGRMHRREDIFRAALILRDTGFLNLSFDLIAGLPHQTSQSWADSVDNLVRLGPEHVSIYMLEIDEGSRLGREVLAGGRRYGADSLSEDDAIAEFYEFARARLDRAGYEHYEISNWALPGRRSRHNLKYWRREPYVGFGAGAHSFDGAKRWANLHDPAEYVARVARDASVREQEETLTAAQALEEELFVGLRQLEGIDLARIEREYRVNLRERIAPLHEQGLVEFDGTRLRIAPGCLAVSNEVFVELLG